MRWASGSATLRDNSYFEARAPNAPAMPQQPVSSIVTLRSGNREVSAAHSEADVAATVEAATGALRD